MQKELTLQSPPPKYLIQSDDLKYDGKDLIIPSYWTDTVVSALNTVDGNLFTDEDYEDILHFIRFLQSVQSILDDKNKSHIKEDSQRREISPLVGDIIKMPVSAQPRNWTF